MVKDNMEVWDKLKTPPGEALKKIQGGRLKGMSDINPQWRYEIMTETFGSCGVGWKYEIVRTWTEPGSEGQIIQFAEIYLFTKQGEDWSSPVPGIGGSMLIEMETKGLHTSDEALKMAVTDALSVAMKMIGVAADVYRGFTDNSKYQKPRTEDGDFKPDMMTIPQRDKINELIEHDKIFTVEANKVNVWMKKTHTFTEAQKTIGQLEKWISERKEQPKKPDDRTIEDCLDYMSSGRNIEKPESVLMLNKDCERLFKIKTIDELNQVQINKLYDEIQLPF